jgi:hypothetical protein
MENLTYWAKIAAIYFMFLQTFVLAAGEKWLGGGVPEWFAKQFGPSVMGKFPGLAASYFGIAALETTVAVLFLASAAKLEFLPGRAKPLLKLAITAAAFTFGALAFGQRLTHEYAGAADLFFYFGAALVALLTVEREENRDAA